MQLGFYEVETPTRFELLSKEFFVHSSGKTASSFCRDDGRVYRVVPLLKYTINITWYWALGNVVMAVWIGALSSVKKLVSLIRKQFRKNRMCLIIWNDLVVLTINSSVKANYWASRFSIIPQSLDHYRSSSVVISWKVSIWVKCLFGYLKTYTRSEVVYKLKDDSTKYI